MSMAEAVTALTGRDIVWKERLHGGDLSEVVRLSLTPDHFNCVAKRGPMVVREANMLEALAHAGAPVPDVIGVHDDVMLMEHLPDGPATPEAWIGLGAALNALHAVIGAGYGWSEDYAFGPVVIENSAHSDWPGFWAERRLMAGSETLPPDIVHRVEVLATRLPDLLPVSPRASLLHGDLWRGNVHFSGGQAILIDPACYHGDAEVDLAMLTLFGAPPPAFFDAYDPLPPGYAKRRAIYQLWPALVHMRLFGAGYRGMVNGLLAEVGA